MRAGAAEMGLAVGAAGPGASGAGQEAADGVS